MTKSFFFNFSHGFSEFLEIKKIFQVEVIEGKLFETFLKLTDAVLKKSLNSLREKPDKDRWISAGTTVNAFYSAILNSVSK